MAAEVSERVREIARHRDLDESEIIQQAVEQGLEDLWRDVVVDRYLAGEIEREAALEELGSERLREIERAKAAVESDIEWGLGTGSS
ncbi:hypothetical protein [Natronolimnohabitans innermongolicus]|uniref:Ribbon-helix-helix protein CopG domain-containing protein n=1 Tax=Natronolimnohabitans innermongolicus JCM 12255 TaxID=1227499 RepID=L9XAS2_9EURY|nr:hypothetical protein [Natronolimnohabitans innermongolicus]ELY58742.1 hypothetical protein C493_06227 [Natronolimnohabitans innermongolicus JCM 12255]